MVGVREEIAHFKKMAGRKLEQLPPEFFDSLRIYKTTCFRDIQKRLRATRLALRHFRRKIEYEEPSRRRLEAEQLRQRPELAEALARLRKHQTLGEHGLKRRDKALLLLRGEAALCASLSGRSYH